MLPEMLVTPLDYALAYAAEGMACFPCNPNKRPATPNGFHAATIDPAQLGVWFADTGYWLGLNPPPWLIVLDVDCGPGKDGHGSLAAYPPMPRTWKVRTPSSGYHLYFRKDPLVHVSNRAGVLEHVDVRTKDGYVIAPPSAGYKVEVNAPFADCPQWLLELLTTPAPVLATAQAPVPAGRRNDTLFREATELRALGHSREVIYAALAKRNASCDPPLPAHELAQIAESACRYEPGPTAGQLAELESTDDSLPANMRAFTEAGFARRLTRALPHYRHCYKQGWCAYQNGVWHIDVPQPTAAISDHLTAMQEQIERQAGGAEEPEALCKLLRRAQAHHTLTSISRAMTELAECQIDFKAFDSDPHLLNCTNGTVDLRTGNLRPHRAEDLLTRSTTVPFEPAVPSEWNAALLQYMGGDQEAVDYLQRALGAGLVGEAAPVYHVFLGSGANGKSVVLEVVMQLLGNYAGPLNSSELCKNRGGFKGHTAALGGLVGARFIAAEEIPEGASINTDALKALQGAQRLQLGMGRNFETVHLKFALFCTSNHTPRVTDTSAGALRRQRLLNFDVDVRQLGIPLDPRFAKHLVEREGPAILSWLVAGAKEYLANGLGTCAKAERDVQELNEGNDPLLEWLAACTKAGERTPYRAAYDNYVRWTVNRGDEPVHIRAFLDKLRHKGLKTVASHSIRYVHGLILVDNSTGKV